MISDNIDIAELCHLQTDRYFLSIHRNPPFSPCSSSGCYNLPKDGQFLLNSIWNTYSSHSNSFLQYRRLQTRTSTGTQIKLQFRFASFPNRSINRVYSTRIFIRKFKTKDQLNYSTTSYNTKTKSKFTCEIDERPGEKMRSNIEIAVG